MFAKILIHNFCLFCNFANLFHDFCAKVTNLRAIYNQIFIVHSQFYTSFLKAHFNFVCWQFFWNVKNERTLPKQSRFASGPNTKIFALTFSNFPLWLFWFYANERSHLPHNINSVCVRTEGAGLSVGVFGTPDFVFEFFSKLWKPNIWQKNIFKIFCGFFAFLTKLLFRLFVGFRSRFWVPTLKAHGEFLWSFECGRVFSWFKIFFCCFEIFNWRLHFIYFCFYAFFAFFLTFLISRLFLEEERPSLSNCAAAPWRHWPPNSLA